MTRLVLLIVPILGLFAAHSQASMVLLSGEGYVQSMDPGHQGFGFQVGSSFTAQFRYTPPYSAFPTGSAASFSSFVAAVVEIGGNHFEASRLGSEIQVADSAAKRFRLSALNLFNSPVGFPALDRLMFEVRGGDIFNVHDFPSSTTDLDLDAATTVKIELAGLETTVLALDIDTVEIEVVPEPSTVLLWLALTLVRTRRRAGGR